MLGENEEVPDLYVFKHKPGGGFGIKPISWQSDSMWLLTGSEDALDEGRAIAVSLNAWHRTEVIAERNRHIQALIKG